MMGLGEEGEKGVELGNSMPIGVLWEVRSSLSYQQ